MKKPLVLIILLFLLLNSCSDEKSLTMQIIAGSGVAGFKDGRLAELNKPIRLTAYTEESVIFADINNHAIRIATLSGKVTTIAGGPDKEGYENGPTSLAKFRSPHGVAYDEKNRKVYVAEAGNHVIRVISLHDSGEHEVSTLAGLPGVSGFKDGKADSAMFSSPHGLVLGKEGELIVADIGNASVRLIKDGMVTTVAGAGEEGSRNGPSEVAMFRYPMDLAHDGSDIFIADAGTHLLSKIVDGEVIPIALQDTLNTPHGIALDKNKNLYVADMGTHRILKIDERGRVTTLAGTGHMGNKLEELNKPAALLIHAGYLWIADLNNHQIKALSLD